MEPHTRNTLLALLVGALVGAGLYAFAGYASLAAVAAVCWAVAVKLVLRVGRLYPAFATGEDWTDSRWTGLGGGVVSLAALLGVSPTLPLSPELRLGLGILVLGAGTAAYTAGTLAVLERTETSPEPSTPASDGAFSVSED
jgi:hypothetical protein